MGERPSKGGGNREGEGGGNGRVFWEGEVRVAGVWALVGRVVGEVGGGGIGVVGWYGRGR